MGELGFQELLLIGFIVMIIFGPKKLPQLGTGLGTAIRNFKQASKDSPPANEGIRPAEHDPSPDTGPNTEKTTEQSHVQLATSEHV